MMVRDMKGPLFPLPREGHVLPSPGNTSQLQHGPVRILGLGLPPPVSLLTVPTLAQRVSVPGKVLVLWLPQSPFLLSPQESPGFAVPPPELFPPGSPPATGTGTLLLTLLDVNDNGPEAEPRDITVCQRSPQPQLLTVTDQDLPPNTGPFRAELAHGSGDSWAVEVGDTGIAVGLKIMWGSLSEAAVPWLHSWCIPVSLQRPTGDTVTLQLVAPLEPDTYSVYLRLLDQPGRAQVTVITARVCACEGLAQGCPQRSQPVTALPFVLATLGALLALLREWGSWGCGDTPALGTVRDACPH